jgi:hyperosmotically inducible periplasmic protein
MKKLFFQLVLLVAATAMITTTACKKKPKDADVKALIETALKADPMAANTTVDVKDGVATISGECKDDACKAHCAEMVKGIKGVKEVVNNCTVAPPPPPVEITADDPLTKAVTDAIKSFPGISATVKDGVVSLVGSITKLDKQKLMMAINALKPKKVDVSGLTNK